jgi:hypothetical protein
MNTLSPDGEKALVTAIEQSIRLTHEGLSPNDAITKVAQDNQFGPELIRRMAETFNKTLSVHKFKTAGVDDDRAQVFDLADAGVIIHNIYEPSEKIASAFSLPVGDFSEDVLSAPVMEKTARAADPGTVKRLTAQARIDQGHIRKGIQDQLRLESRRHKLAFDNGLDDLCEHCAPLSPRAFQKTAQFIVNGYPATGPKLLSIVVSRTTQEIGDMEKTANAVVFPRLEPYLTVSRIYDAAEKMAAAELAQQDFDKEGAGFASRLATSSLGNMIAEMDDDPGEKKKQLDFPESTLAPEYFNRMKSHDAKRTFTLLSLYDDELKQYDFPELMKAYNSSVHITPDAYKNPEILRNLMIKNLHSVGVKDPFELKTELEISNILEDRSRRQQETLDKERARKARLSAPDPDAGKTVVRLTEALGKASESIGKLTGWSSKKLDERSKTKEQDSRDASRKSEQDSRDASRKSDQDIRDGDQKADRDAREAGRTSEQKQRDAERRREDKKKKLDITVSQILRLVDRGGLIAAGGEPRIREAAEDYLEHGELGMSYESKKILRYTGFIT